MSVPPESPGSLTSEAPTHRHNWRFAGQSHKPIDGVLCDRPKTLACLDCGEIRRVRCSSSSRVRCAPCGERYRRRVRRIFASGFTDRPTEAVYLVTLTAPSHVGVHRYGGSGKVCPCTPPGGIDLGEWNPTAGRRFAVWKQHLKRSTKAPLEYCRAAEPQTRGALHYHTLVRTPIPLDRRIRALRKLAIRHGFGHEIDVQRLTTDEAASYCAKGSADYVSKAVDDRHNVAWNDPAGTPTRARYRTWSASRHWGLTMRSLIAQQSAWKCSAAAAQGDPPAQRGDPAAALDTKTAHVTPRPPGPSDPPSDHGPAAM